jgi:hypothetical protein
MRHSKGKTTPMNAAGSIEVKQVVHELEKAHGSESNLSLTCL